MAKRRGSCYDEIDRKVGLRLKQLRFDRGYSQEHVGSKIGLTYQQVQKYEKGSTSLACARVPEICAIYSITPNDLFSDVGPKDLDPRQARKVTTLSSWALRFALECEKLGPKQRTAIEAIIQALKS
jgi:transcriptional regulator with XRE-family HTH domain